MTVRVLAFARLRELLGFGAREVDVPAGTDLDALRAQRPARRRRHGARGRRRDRADAPGGRRMNAVSNLTLVTLSAEPLDPDALVRALRDDRHGAVVTFLGVTRETSPDDPRPVAALTYEAYDAMAVPEMEAIASEACERYGPLSIALVHRTGRVELGEPSVAVVVAAPHRGKAFEACRYAIDALKERVAVWKQEIYRDGASAWVANTPS